MRGCGRAGASSSLRAGPTPNMARNALLLWLHWHSPSLRGRPGSALMLQWTWFMMVVNQGSSCIPHLRNARENSLSKRGMGCRLRACWKHRQDINKD